MDKVLQHEASELTIKLDAILEGLYFRFFIYTEGDGVTYHRQIATPHGVRADSPDVAEFIKELNSLTRQHVRDHLSSQKLTSQKSTFTKNRTCFVCQKQSDACKVCGSCKNIRYCSSECQSNDWKEHKKVCNK